MPYVGCGGGGCSRAVVAFVSGRDGAFVSALRVPNTSGKGVPSVGRLVGRLEGVGVGVGIRVTGVFDVGIALAGLMFAGCVVVPDNIILLFLFVALPFHPVLVPL